MKRRRISQISASNESFKLKADVGAVTILCCLVWHKYAIGPRHFHCYKYRFVAAAVSSRMMIPLYALRCQPFQRRPTQTMTSDNFTPRRHATWSAAIPISPRENLTSYTVDVSCANFNGNFALISFSGNIFGGLPSTFILSWTSTTDTDCNSW